jgi:hypothetical protein
MELQNYSELPVSANNMAFPAFRRSPQKAVTLEPCRSGEREQMKPEKGAGLLTSHGLLLEVTVSAVALGTGRCALYPGKSPEMTRGIRIGKAVLLPLRRAQFSPAVESMHKECSQTYFPFFFISMGRFVFGSLPLMALNREKITFCRCQFCF